MAGRIVDPARFAEGEQLVVWCANETLRPVVITKRLGRTPRDKSRKEAARQEMHEAEKRALSVHPAGRALVAKWGS